MPQPLVTVVIPSYNHAAYVGATIESVLSQTHSRVELIVIDDGSGDASVQRIQAKLKQWGEGRCVRLIVRENRGL